MTRSYTRFLTLLGLSLTIVGVLAPASAWAAPVIGFPTHTLWFSKDPFFAGDSVRISTVIIKTSGTAFSGSVRFLDGEAVLGAVPVSMTATEEVKEVSFSWKATAGSHQLGANIADAYTTDQGVKSAVSFSSGAGRTETITTLVDTDANKNGVADTEDQARAAADAAARATSTASTILTTAENLASTTRQYIPAPVTAAASSTGVFLDAGRQALSNTIAGAQSYAHDRLTVLNATSTPAAGVKPSPYAAAEKPFRYVELFLLAIAAFITAHPIVYYVLLAYILYRIIRKAVRMFRGRRHEY